MSRTLKTAAGIAAGTGLLSTRARGLRKGALRLTAVTAAAVAGNEAAGKPVPFLRWSFLRIMLGMKHLTTEWQVGDGREEACASTCSPARRRGPRRRDPRDRRVRYSGAADQRRRREGRDPRRRDPPREAAARAGARHLRRLQRAAHRARDARGAHLTSLEFLAGQRRDRAPEHRARRRGGPSHRRRRHARRRRRETWSTCEPCTGSGRPARLRLLDHAKEAYLPDLAHHRGSGWLHPGSVVVADNIKFPGAPDYRAYMREQEGRASAPSSTRPTSSTSR